MMKEILKGISIVLVIVLGAIAGFYFLFAFVHWISTDPLGFFEEEKTIFCCTDGRENVKTLTPAK